MAETTKIRLMGDVMIGRAVNHTITRMGYEYPWGNTTSILKQDGINIINLETTLTTSDTKVYKVYNFKADPDKINTLSAGNIHAVNLANNHILDFSQEGMEETIDLLNKHGIAHTGAGRNLDEARTPVLIYHNDVKIGLIGCTDNEPGWSANAHPGTFYVKTGDPRKLESAIKELRQEVDILILSIHWGPNMVEEPDKEQINFAHRLADMGVDITHGHSAHIFQGIEIYNEKIILYDTGDFIDDYAIDPHLRNDRSFLYEITVEDKKIKKLKLIPVLIDNMQVNLAEGNVKNWAFARMQNLCFKFKTLIDTNGEVNLL